jgi:hypothetical protein
MLLQIHKHAGEMLMYTFDIVGLIVVQSIPPVLSRFTIFIWCLFTGNLDMATKWPAAGAPAPASSGTSSSILDRPLNKPLAEVRAR